MHYCERIDQSVRRPTRIVNVGNVGVGGVNPVRLQSMTSSPTDNVDATVEQILRLADAGCEIVRVTVQGKKEAKACEEIKNALISKNCLIPLVADIHFYPPAAMLVADFVDKVRINPGNFVDKRASFRELSYDDESYAKELLKIEEKFSPLVLKLKSQGKALRIGTNHGSLSDRIMNRYGDSPEGMVASAIEFAEVCRKHDFHNIIFSMKSSNTHVMIAAYRLLCAKMYELNWDYPMHLGVTEAGMGIEGRTKSSIGIGSLLLDGIGDTVRVSLTEDPWYEIPSCQKIRDLASSYTEKKKVFTFEKDARDIQNITKREVKEPIAWSLHRDGSCIVSVTSEDELKEASNADLFIWEGKHKASIQDKTVLSFSPKSHLEKEIIPLKELSSKLKANAFSPGKESKVEALYITDEEASLWSLIPQAAPELIFLNPSQDRLHQSRHFFAFLKEHKLSMPVILSFSYTEAKEDMVHLAAMECGALLCDGLGDGVWIQGDYPLSLRMTLGFNLLQGSRLRFSKTEFISCPSCGRTLFDLQTVTQEIQARTKHLPGVKIAVMGCIVNGPGEMADADFGYVGSQAGKIDLYVGKERVERNIPFAEGPDRLVALIKAHGRWVEPKELATASP